MAKFSALLLRTLVRVAVAFPVNESLVGFSEPDINSVITSNGVATIPNLPGQPDQIFTAAREGLNFANDFAKFLTYQAFLMNGNSITNLMSLALKSSLTGPDPTRPAYVGGLSQHGTFEGDTNKLFQGFIATSKKFGYKGTYDINAVAELRQNRLVDSIKNNPQLDFTSPLILSAYSKAIFPIIFFIDGRLNNRRLTTDGARRSSNGNTCPQTSIVNLPQSTSPSLSPLLIRFSTNIRSCLVLTTARTTTKSSPTLLPSAINAILAKKNLDFFFSSVVTEQDYK
ncbi:hypothetical protein M422DRAFT_254255 [Sphaerobolus stellatus SS14]|uniref:Heme haloperoxidase family profile domain-containing protein n=1 Tax=Sphaerobolus stellatus (strain SS14) TaxID=990650 RepID=A0A0C9VW05_SPHS4|nr:hypothetical protein M422DRAFT_254255 [Sphaerobolus stellatus SS14]